VFSISGCCLSLSLTPFYFKFVWLNDKNKMIKYYMPGVILVVKPIWLIIQCHMLICKF